MWTWVFLHALAFGLSVTSNKDTGNTEPEPTPKNSRSEDVRHQYNTPFPAAIGIPCRITIACFLCASLAVSLKRSSNMVPCLFLSVQHRCDN
eukprot:5494429-Amphidinium_carterae.4